VNVAAGTSVAKLELLDGARVLDERVAAPFTFAPRIAVGLHSLTAVATTPEGRRHSSGVHTILVE
jgi:hypothetical protein